MALICRHWTGRTLKIRSIVFRRSKSREREIPALERERQSVISITRNYTDHDREKEWIEPGRPRLAGQDPNWAPFINLGRPKN